MLLFHFTQPDDDPVAPVSDCDGIKVGRRVRYNEAGLRWVTNRTGAPPRGKRVEWRGRTGVVGVVSRDKTRARVRWTGCKGLGDYLPLQFLENAARP